MVRTGLLAGACLLSGVLTGARAQTVTYDFNFDQGSGGGIEVTESGTLTATATNVANEYQITGITGQQVFTIGGVQQAPEAILGLLSPDTAYGADDLLFLDGGPLLDTSGFTFIVDGPGSDFAGDVNIALFSGTAPYTYTTPYEIGDPNGTFTVTPVDAPEPASVALLLTGLGFTVAAVKRRRA